jgi:hypothetical protein
MFTVPMEEARDGLALIQGEPYESANHSLDFAVAWLVFGRNGT